MVGVGVVDSKSVNVELAFGVDWRGDWLAGSHASTLENVLGIPVLSEIEAFLSALHIDAEEKIESAHVPNSKLGAELVNNVTEQSRARAGKHDIVDIKKKVGSVCSSVKNKEETELDDKHCKPSVPGARSLFQAVERFVE